MRRLIRFTADATANVLRRTTYPHRINRGRIRLAEMLLSSIVLALLLVAMSGRTPVYAQNQGMGEMQTLPPLGMDANAPGMTVNRMTEGDADSSQHVRIMQPVIASLAASPPYGNAPLTVGFFVTASDPEDIGFLTYQWNFGDGTVSSLPPELYIFHVYQQPGNYVVSLIMKTVDGRSISLFTPIIVHASNG